MDNSELTQLLLAEGLAVEEEDAIRPTGYGVLLFGNEPRRLYPHAGLIVTAIYLDGREEVADFGGPLVDIPEEFSTWLRPRIPNFIDRTEMARRLWSDLPFAVVREAVVNALVHRDYSLSAAKCQVRLTPEELVVMSPGRPVPPISLEQLQRFEAPTLSRNPKIHYVFRQMRLAEEAGRGMATMREVRADPSAPTPQFSFEDPYLVFRLFRNVDALGRATLGHRYDDLTQLERVGWNVLTSAGELSRREYAAAMQVPDRTAVRQLNRFVGLGLAERIGVGKTVRYRALT